MSADDESREPKDDEAQAPGSGDAGEHEAPPPATYAGRRRSQEGSESGRDPEPAGGAGEDEPEQPEAAEDESEQPEAAEDESEQPEAAEDDPRAGFSEEFDEIERDLDAELADLGDDDAEEDAGSPEAEDREPGAAQDGLDPGQTVEADTLSLADRAEAEEAALAGLRARAAKADGDAEPPAAEPEPEAAAGPPPEPVAAAAGPRDGDRGAGEAPRSKRLWARFLAASVVIVVSVAAATSISLLLYLTDIAEGLSDNDTLASLRDQLEEVPAGDPQNILIIGSDKRLDEKGDPGRSDTTILLRVDPDKHAIALLSIPRDLKVNIPGVGVDKFNAAYTAGGPDKTLQVVKQLTGLEISHVVNINFTGFADAVNAIDCVYIDVDRRYYIPEEDETSEIDLEAGYQRMCGYNALQYVRFRHFDNDLVRAARQQDFLREARQKLPPGVLIRDRNELLQIFTDYTTSDIGEAVPLLELLKTFLAVQAAPVREVHFPGELGTTYVTASDEAIQQAVDQFLNAEGTPGERPAGESPPSESGGEGSPAEPEDGGGGGGGDGDGGGGGGGDGGKPEDGGDGHFEGPPMDDSTEQGRTYANQVLHKRKKNGERMIQFPVYYPTRLVPGSFIARDTRAFVIDGPDKEVYSGYKMVVDVPGDSFGHGLLDEFYGVSGTDWVDAPILSNPSEVRTIDGREYLLFYDGDRLRLVGWKTNKAAYWVNNTLLQSLEEGQMLSIATSMREFEEGK